MSKRVSGQLAPPPPRLGLGFGLGLELGLGAIFLGEIVSYLDLFIFLKQKCLKQVFINLW